MSMPSLSKNQTSCLSSDGVAENRSHPETEHWRALNSTGGPLPTNSRPTSTDHQLNDLQNFLEETDLCNNGVPDWYLNYYSEEHVMDDQYNSWQLHVNRHEKGPVMKLHGVYVDDDVTDGIQQDGELHLREYYEHCYWSDQPHDTQDPDYTVVEIPFNALGVDSLDPTWASTHWCDLIGRIIGQGGHHLVRIASSYPRGYIHFNADVDDMTHSDDSLKRFGNGNGNGKGFFELYARQDCLQPMVVQLKRHILATTQTYQRNYFKQKIDAVLEKFQPNKLIQVELWLEQEGYGSENSLLYTVTRNCYKEAIEDFYKKFNPLKVTRVDELLDYCDDDMNYMESWEKLYKRIVQKYAPDGCRVAVCECGLHFVPNTPLPEDATHYCDDCFEARHYDKARNCMTNTLQPVVGQTPESNRYYKHDSTSDVNVEQTKTSDEVLNEKMAKAEQNNEVIDLSHDDTYEYE